MPKLPCFVSKPQCKRILKNPLYNCPPLTACRSKSFTRVCHPFPLLRSASKTSASRRMLNTFFCGFHNVRFTKWQGRIFESCSDVRTGQSLVSILSSEIEFASHLAINSSKSFIINFPFLRSRPARSNNSYVAEFIRINHIQNHTFVCCADYDIPVLTDF